MGVDDVPNRLERRVGITEGWKIRTSFGRELQLLQAIRVHLVLEFPNPGKNLVGHGGCPRIHDQHAVRTDRDRNIASGADQHVNRATHMQHTDFCVLVLLRVDESAEDARNY